jgi:hypothetical protein
MSSPISFSACSECRSGAWRSRAAMHFARTTKRFIRNLLAALDLVGSHMKLLQNPPEEVVPLARRNQELAFHGLRFVMEEDDERYVFWVEKRGPRVLPASDADRRFGHPLREAVR